MYNSYHIIALGKETFDTEITALQKVRNLIDKEFVHAVNLIYQSKGRVVVSGIGKSANIGAKVTATFNSTGTPALFMHAADAIHGDLGMIQPDDVVVLLSKSGNTPEIKVLVPLVQSLGNKIIALCGNESSFLVRHADVFLNVSVDREACPNNLAPTSSTTAQLLMGDALAVALLNMRHFTKEDFARYHPGGTLGKQLYMRVEDLAMQNQKPAVSPDDKIRQIILEISSKRLGATAVLENDKIIGIITDGDLRRMMQKYDDVDPLTARDIMSANPRTIDKDQLAVNAFKTMKDNNITQLLVTANDQYFGVIHLHDILKEGIL